MLYVRGHPRDYDLWRQAGCEGWSYADALPYLRRAEGNWRGESAFPGGSGPLGVSATSVKNLNFPLIRDTARNAGIPFTKDFSGAEPDGLGAVDLTIKDGVRQSASRLFAPEGYPSLNHPESRGEVRLASANPNDSPLIHLNALSTEGDRARACECIRLVRRIYGTQPLADLIVHETSPGPDIVSDADLDAFTRRSAEVGHHPAGTYAMGASPQAVVDSQLRVRGLGGLRVVDASVMPSVPGGNTNAPTIIIAERAADLIRGRPTLAPAHDTRLATE